MIKFVLVTLLAFCGCSTKESSLNEWMMEGPSPRVLCTTAMIGDLVKEVGGDQIETLVLIRGEMDPHSYELVKGDGEKIDRADLIFANGLGLEHGSSMQRVLKMEKALLLGDGLEDLLVIEGSLDPHIWMDVSLFSRTIDPIVAHLSKALPDQSGLFRERGEALKVTLANLDQKIAKTLSEVPDSKRYLVTSHDAFNYFARRYLGSNWESRFQAPEGLAPDGQLSTGDIRRILNHLEKYDIHTLFPESNVSPDSLYKIIDAAKKMGRTIRIVQEPLYGDTMGSGYIEMMEHNALIISEQLGRDV